MTNAAMSASVGARPRAGKLRAATVSACPCFGYSFRVTGTPRAASAAARLREFFGHTVSSLRPCTSSMGGASARTKLMGCESG